MALETVTIPGGLLPTIKVSIGKDASAALTAAIKKEFTDFKAHPTANEIDSGVAGKAGFFNLVVGPTVSSAVTLKAGTGVEGIVAQGSGKDKLIGSDSTSLFIANKGGDSISTALKGGIATVFGGAGADTVSVTGKADLYLEGGKNLVNLDGKDSVSLLGDGGDDTVSISAGDNTVSTNYAATVAIKAASATETLSLAASSETDVTGKDDTIVLSGDDQTLTLSNNGENVSIDGSGVDSITVAVGASDTISVTGGAGADIVFKSKGSDTLDLGGASTVKLVTGDIIKLTGTGEAHITATGSATVIGGKGKLIFTGAASKTATDSVTAGAGGGTLTGGKGAKELFIAGTGAVKMVHGVGGKDTFVGGSKSDSMVGAGKDKTGTDLFKFISTIKGGTHTITSFTSGKDTIDLVGYSKTDVSDAIKAGAKTFDAKTGSETLTLKDGTVIKVSGLTHALGASDVIKG